MLCSTPQDFCEMACSSSFGSLPAPGNVLSITNLGIASSFVKEEHGEGARPCIEANAPAAGPRLGVEPGQMSQAGVAREHDGLVAVLRADLVEHARHVVAHRLLGKLQRRRDLAVVEAARNALEHRALARRELAER